MRRATTFIRQLGKRLEYGYGYLYIQGAYTHTNFAPAGWRVPTREDFQTLDTTLGLWVAGGKMKVMDISEWESPNTGATNEVGWNGKGFYGTRIYNGLFSYSREWVSYPTTTVAGPGPATYVFSLRYNYERLYFHSWGEGVKYGHGIRLIKEDSSDPETLTDYDGNVYNTIKIGDQVWISRNWKCTKLNDGTSLIKVTSSTTWGTATTSSLYYCAPFNDEKYV